MLELEQVNPLREFFDSIKSPITKYYYTRRLEMFFDHCGIEGKDLDAKAAAFVERAKGNDALATVAVTDYLHYLKERVEKKELAESSVSNFMKPVKLFCEQNDITVNWKKLRKRMPRGRRYAADRIPTLDEIKRLLTYPDPRLPMAVTIMLSGGIRLGAWEGLVWGDFEPVTRDGEVVCAKMKVYGRTPDEYQTFVTREAYDLMADNMKFRQEQGEKIGPQSPIMRNLFYPQKGADITTSADRPVALKSTGVKRLVSDALWATGLRQKLPPGVKRHPWQEDHAFRKYFKTGAERGAKSIFVESWMGHSLGVTDSYYRPSESEAIDQYLQAAPHLTILRQTKPESESIQELKKQMTKMEAENKDMKRLLERIEPFLGKVAELEGQVKKLESKGSS